MNGEHREASIQIVTPPGAGLRLRVLGPTPSLWSQIPKLELAGSPFQSEAFVTAWMHARGPVTGNVAHMVALEDEAGLAAALPLEIVRHGPFRIGRFPGETHANANGWLERRGAEGLTAAAWTGSGRQALASAPIDALDLRRIADRSWLPQAAICRPSAEERFGIWLKGGLEGVLERGNAKRKRKKFRAQQRHFEAKGGYVFGDLPPERRGSALTAFLAQKAARFRELGLPDPFSDPGVPEFLQALFENREGGARLYALESGGAFKAILGGVVEGAIFWGMFSSFADDEDAPASPGELLLWHLVDTLAKEGLSVLDLGPGAERYKRSWCDRVTVQYDALIALTPMGRLYVAAAARQQRLTAWIKGQDRLRSAVQRIRRALRRS